MTLREELIAAGKKSGAKAASADPEAVLAIKDTIGRMDSAVDRVSDAADQAQVELMISMGAASEQVDELVARQAAKQAAKKAARDGLPPPASSVAAATTTAPKATKARTGWKAPQDAQTRAKALQDGAPPAPEGMLRCWECFPDLPPASSFDWLGRNSPGEKDRPGQPMKRFLQPGPHRNFPTRTRSKIYIVPLGDASMAPPAKIFAELLRRWFLLEVQMMKAPTGKALDALERDERGCGYGPQIECPSAHNLLHAIRPRDAFIVLGYTMEDICNTAKGFGFLFGEADLDKGVGLFSFARYAEGVSPSSPRFLRRCGMVLCHEATHCFGVRHCVYASCIMNGSNHLEESESRPFSACPVDLRKIQLTIEQSKLAGRETPPFDLVARERGLVEFFSAHGMHEDAAFSRRIVSSLTGQPEPEPQPATQSGAHDEDGGEPPAMVRQKSASEKLEGVQLDKPLVSRQPSGICAGGDEKADTPPHTADLQQLPSHDLGLLVRAYA